MTDDVMTIEELAEEEIADEENDENGYSELDELFERNGEEDDVTSTCRRRAERTGTGAMDPGYPRGPTFGRSAQVLSRMLPQAHDQTRRRPIDTSTGRMRMEATRPS